MKNVNILPELDFIENEIKNVSGIYFMPKELWFRLPFFNGFNNTYIYRKYIAIKNHTSSKYPTLFLEAIYDLDNLCFTSFDIIEVKFDLLIPTIQTKSIMFGLDGKLIKSILMKMDLSSKLLNKSISKNIIKI